MEREQILRDDFPTTRKGWDPDAVRAHLRAVADSPPRVAEAASDPGLAEVAAERVRLVIEAAEQTAARIGAEAKEAADELLEAARLESEGLLSGAQGESERIVARAREEAEARVERARAAVEGLVTQADELRGRVAKLGDDYAPGAEQSGTSEPAAEVPGPVVVPEPTPPTIPEPTPDPVPEPTPDPVPEPTPEPTPDPLPDPVPEPPGPESDPEPPAAASASASTDDLIARLRGGASGAAANGTAGSAAVFGSDRGAVMLVGMNMALDGASREEVSKRLRAEFGEVAELEAVLDEVFERAAR